MSRLIEKLESIITQADQFVVPLFAKMDELQEILIEQKAEVEELIYRIGPDILPSVDILYELWDEAILETDKQYLTEAEKTKMPDIYIQELIYNYAELIGCYILEDTDMEIENESE